LEECVYVALMLLWEWELDGQEEEEMEGPRVMLE